MYTEGTTDFIDDMTEELERTYREGNVSITESDGTYTVTINGKEYTIDGETQVGVDDDVDTATLPTGNGTTPYLPSDDFAQVSGTDLSTGLVIADDLGWDLVLKYLEVKGTSEADLNADSTGWGNYYNATFTLNGKYARFGALSTWYNHTEDLTGCVSGSIKQSASSYYNAILLTTGASDATNMQNICDLAGNLSAWTLEHATTTSGIPCTSRGGAYITTGNGTSASSRAANPTAGSFFSYGFRVTIY